MKILNRNLTEEELRTNKMFTITKYLDACFNNKTEPSMDIMQHVDYEEKSSKHTIYYHPKYGQQNDFIEQNIAENMIDYLPFEAYEKFITEDWLTIGREGNGNTLVNKAFYRKDIQLLEKFHDLGFKKAMEDKEFVHTYHTSFIRNLIRVESHLNNYTSRDIPDDFGVKFLSLIKKTVCEKEYFSQLGFIGKKIKPLKYTANPDWVESASWFSRSYNETANKSLNDLFYVLASTDKYFPIFEDALFHTMKKHSKNLKFIMGLDASTNENNPKGETFKNILGTAFAKNNIPAANMLIETFGLSQKECFDVYEKSMKNGVYYVKQQYSEPDPFTSILKNHFNTSYKKFKKQFFPDFDTQYLPLFILGKDKTLKTKLLEKKDEILHTNMKDKGNNFTLYEAILFAKAMDTINTSLKLDGKALIFSDRSKDCESMDIKHFLAKQVFNKDKLLLNEINYNDLNSKDWNSVFENEYLSNFIKILEGNGKISDIDEDEFKVLWETAMLQAELPSNNQVKKHRSKI